MRTNSIPNYSPTFNARLNIIPKSVYSKWEHTDVIQDLPLNDIQLKLLTNKFEKATKDTKGTLNLFLGEFNFYNPYCNKPSNISYTNGKYKDSIPVIIEPESLTTNDEFVDKLVKMLEIFKFREKNSIRATQMEQKVKDLKQSTRASSLGAAETLFEMPKWRNNKYIN